MIDKVEPVKPVCKITVKPKPKEQSTDKKEEDEKECNESFKVVLDALLADRLGSTESAEPEPEKLSKENIDRSWIYGIN